MQTEQDLSEAHLPLIVDLDGSLIRNDTTYDLFAQCCRWAPFMLPFLIFKLLVSRGAAKRWMANRVGQYLDPAHLPYEQSVLDTIETYRAAGQPVELISGADDTIVQKIAKHLGHFSYAQGSTPQQNLVSSAKAGLALNRHDENFVYIGNSNQDLAVWRVSQGGYGVRAPAKAYSLKNDAGETVPIKTLVKRQSIWPGLLRAMRLHQWSKNVLLFVIPGMLVTSLGLGDYVNIVLAFLSLSFLASATYILNDLFDIKDDRAHSEKYKRPLASGELSVPLALAALSVLGALGFAIAAFIGFEFCLLLGVYAFVTLAYSFRLKRIAIIDVMVLAFLFCLRVIAGGLVIGALVTPWFLSFISLFFLSLAIGKRVIEVQKLKPGQVVGGRGYIAEDQHILIAFGSATGIGAILSFMIYGLVTQNELFSDPILTYATGVILLGWLLRLWLLLGRGQVDSDPVLFAIKDRTSLVALALAGFIISLETAEAWWSRLF